MKADTPKAKKTSSGSGNPRGKGTYNSACDVCARKKTKCDGTKPVCDKCRMGSRELECTWTKNPVRKPRTEQHFEAMQKRLENLQKCLTEHRRYTDYLESLLDQLQKSHQHTHQTIDFRSLKPLDNDNLMGLLHDDFDDGDIDFTLGDDENGVGPEASGDPLPTRELKIEEGIVNHYGPTAPFRFDRDFEPATQPSRFPALAENPNDTYVLIIDDTDSQHYNPDFDWSRHLPSAVPLDRRSHDRALDLLFKFFTSWCLRVVPALFLRDMYRALSVPRSQVPPKTPHYSPMLHNALIALALAFLDDPKFRDLKSRQYFANTAKSYIETECQKPNLSVVHALSILASFHSSQGDQALGYVYFGMSARTSQALGLNVDCSEWVRLGVMDEADRLDRHWTNWTTFTQDVCWSLYVGREFGVSAPDADFSMPIVDPALDQLPWVHGPANMAPQPNYLTKTFEATCELLVISRGIMDVVNGLNRARNRPFVIDELISDIDLKLNTWRNALAPELEITVKSRPTATPHKLMLHLAYWWLFILLHRPFFHRKARPIYSNDREIDHVKLCRRAADNIMELLNTWRNLYTLRYCPITLIQTVFSAGTIYLLIAMQASSGVRVAQKELQVSKSQQDLVLQYLNEIGKSWQCSTNLAAILKNKMEEQLLPLMERSLVIRKGGNLQIPELGDDEEETAPTSLSRSSSRSNSQAPWHGRSPSMKLRQKRLSHSLIHSPSQLSLSGPLSQAPTSPTITISPVHQESATHAPSSSPLARTAPITIQTHHRQYSSSSSFSPSPSSFPDSQWGLRPSTATYSAASPASVSPGSSPAFSSNMLPSAPFVHRGFQPSYVNADDSVFSGNDNGHHGQGHVFHGQGSSSSSGISSLFRQSGHIAPLTPSPPSSKLNHHYPGKEFAGLPGMLGGQTIPQAPFLPPFTLYDGTVGPIMASNSLGQFNGNFSGSLERSPATSFLAQSLSSASLEATESPLDMDTNMDEFPQWESDQWFGQDFGTQASGS